MKNRSPIFLLSILSIQYNAREVFKAPGKFVEHSSETETQSPFVLRLISPQVVTLRDPIWQVTPHSSEMDSHEELYLTSTFLPARRYASAGLCDSDVSVCPSVTHRYCA